MLPPDLLNELITLLDDASTYRSFALASHITSKLCQKGMIETKKRFTVRQKDGRHTWYSLPNSTRHGPDLSYLFTRYTNYLDDKLEGVFWNWYSHLYTPGGGRFISTYYHKGLRHGTYKRWTTTGILVAERNYVKGEYF